jgi:hypothetical protein
METICRTETPDGEVPHYPQDLKPDLTYRVYFSRYQRLVCQRGDQAFTAVEFFVRQDGSAPEGERRSHNG